MNESTEKSSSLPLLNGAGIFYDFMAGEKRVLDTTLFSPIGFIF